MEGKLCAFLGHREMVPNEELRSALSELVEELIKNGYTKFFFTPMGNFDHLAWEVVTYLKNKYSFIQRWYCIEDNFLTRGMIQIPFNSLNFEKIIWLPKEDAVYRDKSEFLEDSDFVIFYVVHDFGRANKAMEYAKKKKVPFVNLGEKINTFKK